MPISRLIEIGRSSLLAAQAAMNVTSENITNANTDGYTRRRLILSSDAAARVGYSTAGSYGTGVSISSYERARDVVLTRSMNQATSLYSYSNEQYRILATLEGFFPEGSGSLGDVMASFWNAWGDLADNPTDNGVRETVRAQGQTLASIFNTMDAHLTRYSNDLDLQLVDGVNRVNSLLESIAQINKTIQAARSSGSPDLSAEDERDRMINELSEIVPLQVWNGTNGAYNVSVGGHLVVEGSEWNSLALDSTGPAPQVVLGGTTVPVRLAGSGRLAALLEARGTVLPELRSRLDTLASTIVQQVNAVHSTRFDSAGDPVNPPAPNFFYYDAGPPERGLSAGSMRISDEVLADASIVGTPGFFTAGGQDIAFAIADLRSAAFGSTENQSAENYLIDTVSRLGASINRASAEAQTRAMAVDHLQAMSEAVSGVSIDEELTHLIKYQQAYAASARVLTTAQQTLDVLFSI